MGGLRMIGFALLTALVLSLSGAASLSDLGSPPARQYLAEAAAQYGRAPAVHVEGVFSRDGQPFQVDVTIDKGGDSQGTVVASGLTLQYRYAGGRAYVLADRGFWSAEGRLAPFLGGRWVTSPDAAATLSTAALSRSLSLLDAVRPGVTFNRKGQPTQVGGVPALPLSDRNGEVYVSTAKPVRFLRLVSSAAYRAADGISDVRIDLDYPASLAVQAPSPVVDTGDPATLPAQYVLEDGSLKHGGDCDSFDTCTLTGTVRNENGPQVGSPSVEFDLAKEDGSDLGSCTAAIGPVGHDQTETVSCTVSGRAWVAFTRVGGSYQASVTVHNPFYDG